MSYSIEDVTVITDNNSVHKILNDLKINNIFLDTGSGIKKILKFRLIMDNIISNLDLNKEIYLLDNIHCIEGFYLMKKWTKGKAYYKNLSINFNIYKKQKTIKDLVKKKICKLFFGLNLIFRDQNGTAVLGINNFFLKNNNIINFDIENYNKIKLDVLKNIELKTLAYNSILILQGELKGIVKSISLSRIFNEISSLSSLVIKEHPNHKNTSLIYDLPKIPHYYPIELCYNNISSNIISIYSTSLILASQFENRKVISLLELVEWYNEEYKKFIKGMLIDKSNNKILFPKSITDLRKILKPNIK